MLSHLGSFVFIMEKNICNDDRKEKLKIYMKKKREENIEYYREYDRKNHKKNYKRNCEKIKKRKEIYTKKYSERVMARVIVRQAIKKGELKKQPCKICGEINGHAHHEDYSKPLEIIWLCTICHKKIHLEYKIL